MARVIVAERKLDCTHLLGKFVDESHYDHLIEEDTDVYMPVSSVADDGNIERRIVLKFRKNYFTKQEQDAAYAGLRDAATETQNRGLAAGPRSGKLGNREWVTEYEYEMVDFFLAPAENLFGEDPVEAIRAKYRGKPTTVSNRSNVWSVERVRKENFVFEDWVDKTKLLSPEDQVKAATFVAEKLITNTTYANSVNSGIAGWFDRYPRIPFARATAYTENNFDKFKMAYPFLQSLAKGFKDLLPWRYNNQMDAAKKLDPEFLVPETPFTTVTVNKTFRTAAHYDAGDYTEGLSNLLVLSNNGNYKGGYLIAPEYRVAVNARPGDLLLINNHEVMHGNTPIELLDDTAERISLVVYFREKMLEAGSKEYEDYRKEFIEARKANKEHPLQRPLWNGISSGCFSDNANSLDNIDNSREWYDFLKEHPKGNEWLEKHHPWLIEHFDGSSLDAFFS